MWPVFVFKKKAFQLALTDIGSQTWPINETQFLPSSGRVDIAVWMHYLDGKKTAGEKARRQLNKNAASNIEQVLEATLHKEPTIRPSTTHHENYPR